MHIIDDIIDTYYAYVVYTHRYYNTYINHII
jgi:hypothetical protein